MRHVHAAHHKAAGPPPGESLPAETLQVAAGAYPPSDTSSFRHLRVEEFGDAVAALPPEVRRTCRKGWLKCSM